MREKRLEKAVSEPEQKVPEPVAEAVPDPMHNKHSRGGVLDIPTDPTRLITPPTVEPKLPTVEDDDEVGQKILRLSIEARQARAKVGEDANQDVSRSFIRLITKKDWRDKKAREHMREKSTNLMRIPNKEIFDILCKLLDEMWYAQLAGNWWTLPSLRALFKVSTAEAETIAKLATSRQK
jgi:hypothetical protein